MYLQRWHGWCHMKLLPSFGCFQGLRWQITVSTKLLSFGKWCIKTSLELLCFAAHLAVFCHIGVKSRGWYITYSASNFLHVVSRFFWFFYYYFSILSAKVHTHTNENLQKCWYGGMGLSGLPKNKNKKVKTSCVNFVVVSESWQAGYDVKCARRREFGSLLQASIRGQSDCLISM